MTQAVSTSKFETFVSSRFAEVETLTREALPRVTFTKFVAKMETASAEKLSPDTDTYMGISGAKQSEAESNDSPEALSPADTAKRRTLSRQRTEQ